MQASMIRSRFIALSAALGLFFAGFHPLHKRECYLPSPAADSSLVGESFGPITVIEADEVEFSLRFLEWLRELF